MLNELQLTGRTRTHVVQRDDLGAALHPAALEAFAAMRADAAREGIDIAIASAFRDFEAQQRIWDMKYRGERPLYDAQGKPRNHADMDEGELVEAILCWSALPGASRHHWGTEIDVYDRAAMPEGYRLRLLPEEAAPGGVFHRLHQWLDQHMGDYGFYRPYATYRGGVLPEAWHLSYAAVSTSATRSLTLDVLERTVRASTLLGKEHVLNRLSDIHARYVMSVDEPPVD
ncbi:MAG: M15 family metallopeptidase [Rhodospirillaceae bacterium]